MHAVQVLLAFLGGTHSLHGSAAFEGGQLPPTSSACPPASLLSSPSSQEPFPAAESPLEEAGVTEVAAMRRQVRWG